MTDKTALLAKLARLAATNAGQRHLADRLCEAGRLILGADGAWITLQDGSSQRLPLSLSDQTATALENLQDLTGQGPCLTAYRQQCHAATSVRDQPDPRWPEFSRAAWHELGAVTVHAYPMRPDSDVLGVMAVYYTHADGPAESDESAQFLADAIGRPCSETRSRKAAPAATTGCGRPGPKSTRPPAWWSPSCTCRPMTRWPSCGRTPTTPRWPRSHTRSSSASSISEETHDQPCHPPGAPAGQGGA